MMTKAKASFPTIFHLFGFSAFARVKPMQEVTIPMLEVLPEAAITVEYVASYLKTARIPEILQWDLLAVPIVVSYITGTS